ncbi:MAG: tetratricopeptide repeat protein [Opitutae bacterium]|nr:tetratricopeptide repeat protein [Opitutae bacterium]
MNPAQLQRQLQEAIKHHQAGRLSQAEAIYRRIRSAAPANFDVWHLLGVIAIQQGRATEAVELLTKAHKLSPPHAVCAMRLGLAHLMGGHGTEAEAFLAKSIQLNPQLPEAWDNLAYCYKTQNRLREAIECHQKVTALKPDYAIGWYNFGLTLSLYGQPTEALKCHERSLVADPNYAYGHYGRAQALQQLHCMPEAIAAYDRFLAKEPMHFEARSYRLFALNYGETLTREQVFAEHINFGRDVGTYLAPAFPNCPEPARKLRVAILSPDLHTHSCAYFIEPLVQHLDREQFEICLYHDHFREDAVSQRLKSFATVWRQFVGLSGPAVMEVIRADQPDILIDLAGHTGMTNRLPLFAQHLAPVQISYLGYPNTTGVPAIGYRFTDAIADPPGAADRFATEKLVRFSPVAWAYRPLDSAPAVAPVPSADGAPVTFGCFNNLGKVSDTMLAVWARILAVVPGSRLMLKGPGLSAPAMRTRYLHRLAAAGLPVERVELIERTAGTEEHLALYHRVDIALDTSPYSGTTTTCEALWMGVPVVTLRGDRHAARVSASLLTALGRPEWIATSVDDYVRIAVELTSDPTRLAGIRAGLREEMRRSALLDHAGQARRFGDALRECWAAWCEKQAAVAACSD